MKERKRRRKGNENDGRMDKNWKINTGGRR
jgi:hypothetical protein